MPNWTENEIYAEGEKAALQRFLALIGDDFDFNRIVPMPEILKRTNCGGCTIDGQQVTTWFEEPPADGEQIGKPRLPTAEEASELAAIGYNNWYDWSCHHWGVKWSASNVDIEDGAEYGYVQVHFNTPWSEPRPIFEKLRDEFPDVDFSFRWRHEDDPRYPHSM